MESLQEQERCLPKKVAIFRPLLLLIAGISGALSCLPTQRLSAFISLGDGNSSVTIARVVSQSAPWLMVCALVATFVATRYSGQAEEWFRRRLAEFANDQGQRPNSTSMSELLKWAAVVVMLVMAYDGPTLVWGFFESDDYDLFRVYRENGFWPSVLMTHNDHVIPLLRVETACVYSLFGANPLAYNIWYLVSFSIMLFSGCLWLREIGVSRWSTGMALFLCSGWTLWGQFTTGALILQKYMQITACSGFVLWGWERWSKTKEWQPAIVVWAGLAISTLMNVSGFWVPCALIAAAVCRAFWAEPESPNKRRRINPILFWIVSGLIVAVAVTVYKVAYALPGNGKLFTLAKTRPTLTTLVVQETYFVGTLVLSVILPTPHHLAKLKLLWPVVAFSLFGAAVVWGLSYRNLNSRLRGALVTATLTLIGIGLMVCLGRPEHQSDYIWAIKYLGPGYFWLCLMIGLMSDSFILGSRPEWRTFTLKLLTLFSVMFWTVHGAYNVCVAAGIPFLQVDISRWGQLREHEREHSAVRTLREEIFVPLERTSVEKFQLPDVEGDALCKVFPELAYTWGETPRLSVFTDVLLKQPQRVKWIRADSTDAEREIHPSVQAVLNQSVLWQRLMSETTSPTPP